MTELRLVTPRIALKDSFADALREDPGIDQFKKLDPDYVRNNFEAWYRDRHDLSIPVILPNGTQVARVKHSDFWLTDGKKFLGALSLRHTLGNENLKKYGGHIGYMVRKSERRKGYGALMLQLALPHAKALGLEKVLVTCSDDNTGSARIIEKAGGVLEGKVFEPGADIPKRRYWISL